MMKLFYKIWVDAIELEKSKKSSNGKWKGFTMAYMSILVGVNVATIYSLLFLYGLNIGKPIMQWLSFIYVEDFRNIIWSCLVMFLPALLINYILIFYKKKYEVLILKYTNENIEKGKLLRIYFFVSFALMFGISLLHKLM